MGLFSKLKMLFQIKKPLGDIADAVAEAKKTKKWVSFSLTVLSIIGASGAAIAGLVPPIYAIMIPAIANALYNVFRGADKADNVNIKGLFTTSEFYVTTGQEAQKILMLAQSNGIETSVVLTAILASIASWGSLAAGQNLASRVPDTANNVKVAPVESK